MFRFPKTLYNEWIQNSGNADLIGESPTSIYTRKLCQEHFRKEDILPSGRLVHNAVPIKYTPLKSEESPAVKLFYQKSPKQYKGMVRTTTRESWSLEGMKEAIAALLEGRMGYTLASETFNVPLKTLIDRVMKARQYQLTEVAANKSLRRSFSDSDLRRKREELFASASNKLSFVDSTKRKIEQLEETFEEEKLKLSAGFQLLENKIRNMEQLQFVRNEIKIIMTTIDAMNSPSSSQTTLEQKDEENFPKRKRVKGCSKKSLNTEQLEEGKSTEDGKNTEENESCAYIKQEALETEIHNYGHLIANTNSKEEETIVPEIFPDDIKAESFDIMDDQTITTLGCSQHFEEVWDMEHPLNDKHCESESTDITKQSQRQYSNKPWKVIQSPSQTASPSTLKVSVTNSLKNLTATPTSRSSTSTQEKGTTQSTQEKGTTQSLLSLPSTSQFSILGDNLMSKQHFVDSSKAVVKNQSTFLPIATPSSTVALSLPSPLSPPPPINSISTSAVDSSETFSISLAQFTESQRVGIKKKLLEVVEIVEKLKVNPEMIVIAHKL